jgi:mono/diheme cytochrome c family protein
MARGLLLLAFFLICFGLGLAVTQESMSPRPKSEIIPEVLAMISGYSEQVSRGASTYDLICSNCHGNLGLGIEEGRQEFLPEHQTCERCHRPFNSATLAEVEISDKNSFNIGNPPALKGTLEKFGTALGLYSYIKATMPRYAPESLSEQEYLDITAFLMVLNQGLDKDTILTLNNLQDLKMGAHP